MAGVKGPCPLQEVEGGALAGKVAFLKASGTLAPPTASRLLHLVLYRVYIARLGNIYNNATRSVAIHENKVFDLRARGAIHDCLTINSLKI